MTFRMFDDRILVKPIQQDYTTPSGIVAVVNPGGEIMGAIVARGEGVKEPGLQPGVVVMFPDYAGQELPLRSETVNERYLVLRESDVIAYVEEM